MPVGVQLISASHPAIRGTSFKSRRAQADTSRMHTLEEDLKELGRQNRLWRLNTGAARVIVEHLAPDESPLLVLPMRDVWVAGTRMPGMRPTVCLTDRQLVAVTRPGLLGKANCEVVDRSQVTGLSAYENRSFCVALSHGSEVRLRGMIGEGAVDEMTERLYAALQSGVQ